MKLCDLANRYYKFAVVLTIADKKIAGIIQNIAKNTQLVYDYVTGQVKLGGMVPESQNHASRLRVLVNAALNMVALPEPDWDALTQKTQEIAGEFETLRNGYLPQSWIDANNYEPMKEIRDGLAAVEPLLQQQQNSTEQPIGSLT